MRGLPSVLGCSRVWTGDRGWKGSIASVVLKTLGGVMELQAQTRGDVWRQEKVVYTRVRICVVSTTQHVWTAAVHQTDIRTQRARLVKHVGLCRVCGIHFFVSSRLNSHFSSSCNTSLGGREDASNEWTHTHWYSLSPPPRTTGNGDCRLSFAADRNCHVRLCSVCVLGNLQQR